MDPVKSYSHLVWSLCNELGVTWGPKNVGAIEPRLLIELGSLAGPIETRLSRTWATVLTLVAQGETVWVSKILDLMWPALLGRGRG